MIILKWFTSQVPEQLNKTWPNYNDLEKGYMTFEAREATIGHRYHEQTCNLYEAIIDYFTRKKWFKIEKWINFGKKSFL